MSNRAVLILIPPYLQIADLLREDGWEVYGFSAGLVPDRLKDGCSGFLDLYEVVKRAKRSPIPDDIRQRCQSVEEEYQINLADIIGSDRHLGAGWVLGGLYPRGNLSDMPYERHLHIIHEMFDSVSRYLQQVQPSFVCAGGVGSAFGAIMYAVGARHDIPVLGLTTVTPGTYYWQLDRFSTIPGIVEIYEELKSSPSTVDHGLLDDIGAYKSDMLPVAKARMSLRSRVRRFYQAGYPIMVGRIRGKTKTGDIHLRAQFRHLLLSYLGFRREMRRKYASLSEVAEVDYIYFPLHMEPEASLIGIEPHFTNQTHAIELLSKSVPTGLDVVVKEHWNAVGFRPAGWIDTIAQFPRVRLVHPFENAVDLIRHSVATATIAGTTGLESIVMGKPVISLGPNYRFNFVDHVYFANDLYRMRELIKGIHENGDYEAVIRSGDALRGAIEKTTFRTDRDLISAAPTPSSVSLAYDHLLKVLTAREPHHVKSV